MTRRYVRRRPPFSLNDERALTALRCAAGRVVSSPALIAAIYEGHDTLPIRPEVALRQTIQRLRRAGHPVANAPGEGYALSAGWEQTLSPRYRVVLERLSAFPGKFVSHADLVDAVWPQAEARPASALAGITYLIRRLRGVGCDIVADKRMGYRLDAIVEGGPRPALRLAPDGTTEPWRL